MNNTENKLKKGIVGPVRFAFLSVFKPRKNYNENGMEFSVVLLIPKEPNEFCKDPKAIGKALTDQIKEVAEAKFGSKTVQYKNPFQDGDKELRDDGTPKHPGYWFVRASAKEEYPPKLIDGKKNEVTNGWQSGDWGYAQVHLFAYDNKSKGVGIGLRAIQFLRHDEPLGGGGVNLDDFDIEESDEPLDKTTAQDDFDPFAD